MISDIEEVFCGSYRAIYQDREGNKAKVDGTFAFGAALSWYIRGHGYYVIEGYDQGRIIPEECRI
jgi:hypothetical protein